MPNHSRESLMSVLDYSPETGVFRWKVDRNKSLRGKEAGSINARGYRVVEYEGRAYALHRLAWLFSYGVWPTVEIDHKNLVRSDNRLDNLREATRGQNIVNSGVRVDNTSGHKGVSWASRQNRWKVQVQSKGEKYSAYFLSKDDAISDYRRVALQFFGEFFRAQT